MTRKLTLKQKEFIKQTIATNNPAEAARRAYNIGSKGGSKTKQQANETASSIVTENLRKPAIRKELQGILNGIDDRVLNQKLQQLLTGRKEVVAGGKVIEIVDNTALSDGLDKVFKLKGSYAPDKQVNLNITAQLTDTELSEELRRITDRLQAPTSDDNSKG